jgi:triacylglycerol lipase
MDFPREGINGFPVFSEVNEENSLVKMRTSDILAAEEKLMEDVRRVRGDGSRKVPKVLHHVYFAPGMFGFARLASYDYFAHVRNALTARFKDAGQLISTHVVDVLPTASVRRRAAKLAALIDRTSGGKGPIHLVGHSSGGLDARMVASPSSQLPIPARALRWLPRLRSVTTMNAPHYGTPLASFFVTSNGQHVLSALSAFTLIGLSLGARPLGAAGALIGLIGRGDHAMGINLRILDKSVDLLRGLVDDARRPDVHTYINAIKEDQGSMLQISPEAMDLTVAGFEDRLGVAYQSTASMAPTPSLGKWVRTLGHPWRAVSLALFTALHGITSRYEHRYPCAAARADKRTDAMLARALGFAPDLRANDGIVPIRSQLWGTLVWAGLGDHLDVLGHYRDDRQEKRAKLRHHDWLTSGSLFGSTHFEALMDAVAKGMLKAV